MSIERCRPRFDLGVFEGAPLLTFDCDEPSDLMIAKIKEIVPQDQFVADESL